jgi:predicted HicB family RNase H-like nuclease
MGDTLNYKNYHGKVEYSVEDRCLHGKILGINALVTFEGGTPDEIETAFRESVDDYLDLCERTGITPEREYSGQIKFRPGSDLHRRIDMYANMTGASINSIIINACESYIEQNNVPDTRERKVYGKSTVVRL